MEILDSETNGMEAIGSHADKPPPIFNFAADRDGERGSGADESDGDYHKPGERYDLDQPYESTGFTD